MRRRRAGEELTDEALIAGMAAGDPQAALAFVRRHQDRVFGIALAVVRERHTAEDVAQRAFERAWRHSAVFDPRKGSAAGWLTTITRNLAIDTLRVHRPTPVEPEELGRILGTGPEEPEARAVASDETTRLIQALRGLPVTQTRAVVMGGLYGMPYADIALIEGVPVNTVKTRVRTAMGRLRETLVLEAERSRRDDL